LNAFCSFRVEGKSLFTSCASLFVQTTNALRINFRALITFSLIEAQGKSIITSNASLFIRTTTALTIDKRAIIACSSNGAEGKTLLTRSACSIIKAARAISINFGAINRMAKSSIDAEGKTFFTLHADFPSIKRIIIITNKTISMFPACFS